jgi:hypothetical protein
VRKNNAGAGWERVTNAVAGLVAGCGSLVGEAREQDGAMGDVEMELAVALQRFQSSSSLRQS